MSLKCSQFTCDWQCWLIRSHSIAIIELWPCPLPNEALFLYFEGQGYLTLQQTIPVHLIVNMLDPSMYSHKCRLMLHHAFTSYAQMLTGYLSLS